MLLLILGEETSTSIGNNMEFERTGRKRLCLFLPHIIYVQYQEEEEEEVRQDGNNSINTATETQKALYRGKTQPGASLCVTHFTAVGVRSVSMLTAS